MIINNLLLTESNKGENSLNKRKEKTIRKSF